MHGERVHAEEKTSWRSNLKSHLTHCEQILGEDPDAEIDNLGHMH